MATAAHYSPNKFVLDDLGATRLSRSLRPVKGECFQGKITIPGGMSGALVVRCKIKAVRLKQVVVERVFHVD